MKYLRLLLLVGLLGCSRESVPEPIPTPEPETAVLDSETGPMTPHRALRSGTAFLRKQQSPDGAWRSDVYATFKDGSALTPLILVSLQQSSSPFITIDASTIPALDSKTAEELKSLETVKVPDLNTLAIGCAAVTMPVDDSAEARKLATQWLVAKVKPDGSIDEGPDKFPYPIYTAAYSVIALSHLENSVHYKERDAWLKYLLARQLNESNGWDPDDKQYGGWGYYPRIPVKPAPGQVVPAQQLLESNLSATVLALEALQAAGVADPKVLEPARKFVESCQNSDGGFHFIYDDPVRNKAGVIEGKFLSYGSTTADGVRALLLAGAKPDDPKVQSGKKWLEENFKTEEHPGQYISAHERNRNAVYFYYAASVNKTLQRFEANDKQIVQMAELRKALTARQNPDGSWTNRLELVRENEPLIATAFAVHVLSNGR